MRREIILGSCMRNARTREPLRAVQAICMKNAACTHAFLFIGPTMGKRANAKNGIYVAPPFYIVIFNKRPFSRSLRAINARALSMNARVTLTHASLSIFENLI